MSKMMEGAIVKKSPFYLSLLLHAIQHTADTNTKA
jgi:hypothetical protein|eukprot:COSAG01_NODE_8477_length_2771_cov_42.866018_3_plen_35_part_00